MFGRHRLKQQLFSAEERIEALEIALVGLMQQVEALEERIADYGDDVAARENEARLAEQAFTDGVASILNYSAKGRAEK